MQMTGIAELVTLAGLWRSWPGPRFVVCVLFNGDLAKVSWEQRKMEGDPRWAANQSVPVFPYGRVRRPAGPDPHPRRRPRRPRRRLTAGAVAPVAKPLPPGGKGSE